MNYDPASLPACFTETIRHANFDACLHRLLQLVRMKTSTRIVIVTGPTGAGKTTLIDQLCTGIKAYAAPEMQADPEMVPVGVCSVKAPGPRAFSWKDTYFQVLKSLQHPFIEAPSFMHPRDSAVAEPVLRFMSTEATYRLSNDRLFRVLQRTIQHRKPKALIFDEAHHLLRLASSQSLVNQLEHLKYIADETRTLHILFGTYELTRLMDLSSALIRRREVVHFSRYVYDRENEEASLTEFAKVVAVFARDLEAVSDVDLLTEEVPYLYKGCLGCVGVLRDWLCRAYTAAKETKRGKITKAILEQTMLASSDLLELIKDAKGGEHYFRKRSLCEEEYLTELGFRGYVDPEDCGAKPGSNPARPFKRKPHNDAVGTDLLGEKPKRAA
jgi:ABC-type taurine transport system ATPase subunit